MWFAPSDLWNKHARERYSIICPLCFVELVESDGGATNITAWKVAPEDLDAQTEIIALRRKLADGAATEQPWMRVGDEQPEPHARYVVRRGDIVFTATPCYGMHDPWWVARTPNGGAHREHDPINMIDDDLWQAKEKA